MADSRSDKDALLIRAHAPGGSLSVIIEDDGRVAYAYLLSEEDVVGDVWLYNNIDPPEEVSWEDPATMPFLNPKGNCSTAPLPRITQESDASFEWHDRGVRIFVGGLLLALLDVGSKPGWSRWAIRPSPLAQPLK